MRKSWIAAAAAALVAIAFGLARLDEEPPAVATVEGAAGLAALGYVEWVEGEDDLSRVGVVRREPDATPGLTLVKSRNLPDAHLIDLDGNVVHTWKAPRLDLTDWRSLLALVHRRGSEVSWDHVEVLPGGDLMASIKNRLIERVSWDSKLRWRTAIPAHHDLDVFGDGRVVTLVQKRALLGEGEGAVPIVDNALAVLSPDGALLREVSLAALFGARVDPERLEAIRRGLRVEGDVDPDHLLDLQDVFHANSVEILRRDVPGLGRTGQLLISIRELDLVAVVDLGTGDVPWTWGPGELDRQHHPSVMPNGHVLVFDNGAHRGWSRIVELDPVTREIVWTWSATPREAFFSHMRGSVQWLPGDHFLIAESDRGHAFEIDRHGRVVWEYFNPDIDRRKEKRAPIYRIERLVPQRVASLPLAHPAAVGSGPPASDPR